MRPFLLFGGLLATIGGIPAQTTVAITCDRDNTLYEDPSGSLSNGAGVGLFVGKNALGQIRRTLVHFDVAAVVPAGARVVSVWLTFRISPNLTSSQTATAHRVLQNWGEGTSVAPGNGGAGAPAASNDATWLHSLWPGSLWTNPGGDYQPTPSLALNLTLGLNTSSATPAGVADVQQWLDQPSQNFGWLLRNSEVAASTANRIDSRESTSPLLPTLSVTYMTPGTAGFWGIGCPMAFGNYGFAFVGAPVGGTTITMEQMNGPASSLSGHLFALDLAPVGLPLMTGCTLFLPLANIISGPIVALDGGGAAITPFLVPAGFPGFVVVCQTVALANNALGFVISNAGLVCLQ